MLCHVFCEFARRTIPHPVPALLLSQDDPCHSSQAPLKSGFSRFCQWKAELGDCRAGGWKKLECLSLPPSLVASLAGPVFSVLAGDPARSGLLPVRLQPFQHFHNEVPILLSSVLRSFPLAGHDWLVQWKKASLTGLGKGWGSGRSSPSSPWRASLDLSESKQVSKSTCSEPTALVKSKSLDTNKVFSKLRYYTPTMNECHLITECLKSIKKHWYIIHKAMKFIIFHSDWKSIYLILYILVWFFCLRIPPPSAANTFPGCAPRHS